MKRQNCLLASLAALLLLGACDGAATLPDAGASDAAIEPTDATPGSDAPEPRCTRGVLEGDFLAMPWAGPGVDPETGALLAFEGEGQIVSTTYLTLRPGAETQQRFGELASSTSAQLQVQDGLVAVAFGSSESCGTVRTLAVWRDLEAMYAFVASDAHTTAMSAIGELSRGQSMVHHWDAPTAAEVDWDYASTTLGAHDGTEY